MVENNQKSLISKDENKDLGSKNVIFGAKINDIIKDSGKKIKFCDFWRENSKYRYKDFGTKIQNCDFWP